MRDKDRLVEAEPREFNLVVCMKSGPAIPQWRYGYGLSSCPPMLVGFFFFTKGSNSDRRECNGHASALLTSRFSAHWSVLCECASPSQWRSGEIRRFLETLPGADQRRIENVFYPPLSRSKELEIRPLQCERPKGQPRRISSFSSELKIYSSLRKPSIYTGPWTLDLLVQYSSVLADEKLKLGIKVRV